MKNKSIFPLIAYFNAKNSDMYHDSANTMAITARDKSRSTIL